MDIAQHHHLTAARGCKAWWWPRPHGPTAPQRCEWLCRSAADPQARREAVPQRVRCGVFRDVCKPDCSIESPLKGLVVQVMPPHDTAARFCRMMVLRKQPERSPVGTGTRLLPLQRTGQLDACRAVCNIPAPDLPAPGQWGPQTRHQRCRQHHHAVLAHPAARWHAARNRCPRPAAPAPQRSSGPCHRAASEATDARRPSRPSQRPPHPGSAPPSSSTHERAARCLASKAVDDPVPNQTGTEGPTRPVDDQIPPGRDPRRGASKMLRFQPARHGGMVKPWKRMKAQHQCSKACSVRRL